VPEPRPLSPFEHRDRAAILLQAPDLQIEERAFVTKLSIRGRMTDTTFATRFRDAFEAEPPSPGTAIETDVARILPAGPSEWLAVDCDHDLRTRLSVAGLIAIDVSSGMTILRAAGSGLHPALRKLAPLSFERMAAGSVARTRIGKLPILVHALAPDLTDLFVARSFARSFFEQLQDAAGTA
jgi:heterotetrameric sarcosine oxidase gamma subunit